MKNKTSNSSSAPSAARCMRLGTPLSALLALAVLTPGVATAGIVHIEIQQRAGTEYGAGYTVGRGQECFIVTPFHVVQFAPADSISVTDTKGSVAKARLLKGSEEFDAALLQIVGASALDCPADWSDGASSVAAIGAAQFLIARKVDDTGRVMQSRFFAASTSREQVELQPFGANDELREGDSGSALYAGDALVGLIVSVDTKSRQALAVTQSQLHGLFGADVLPGARRTAVVAPFTYRKVENAYATVTAREFLAGPAGLQLMDAAVNGAPPAGADYLILGDVIDVTSTRAANPSYKPPVAAPKEESLGRQLLRNVERRVTEEVDDALARNSNAQFLRTYNVDVQIELIKTADGSKALNLERRSIVLPETDATPADMEKTAVAEAVKQTLELTLQKHPL
jgi:hypothetical protein